MNNRSRHFVIINLDASSDLDEAAITRTLNRAVDWIEYMPRSWLLWTTSSSKQWYSRLKSVLGPGHKIFVCEVDVGNRSGSMPRTFWKFIEEKTSDLPA